MDGAFNYHTPQQKFEDTSKTETPHTCRIDVKPTLRIIDESEIAAVPATHKPRVPQLPRMSLDSSENLCFKKIEAPDRFFKKFISTSKHELDPPIRGHNVAEKNVLDPVSRKKRTLKSPPSSEDKSTRELLRRNAMKTHLADRDHRDSVDAEATSPAIREMYAEDLKIDTERLKDFRAKKYRRRIRLIKSLNIQKSKVGLNIKKHIVGLNIKKYIVGNSLPIIYNHASIPIPRHFAKTKEKSILYTVEGDNFTHLVQRAGPHLRQRSPDVREVSSKVQREDESFQEEFASLMDAIKDHDTSTLPAPTEKNEESDSSIQISPRDPSLRRATISYSRTLSRQGPNVSRNRFRISTISATNRHYATASVS